MDQTGKGRWVTFHKSYLSILFYFYNFRTSKFMLILLWSACLFNNKFCRYIMHRYHFTKKIQNKSFHEIRITANRHNFVWFCFVFSVEPHYQTNTQDCGLCWKLLFYLCPTCAVFSSLLSSLLVYHFSKKTGICSVVVFFP